MGFRCDSANNGWFLQKWRWPLILVVPAVSAACTRRVIGFSRDKTHVRPRSSGAKLYINGDTEEERAFDSMDQ